MGFRQELLLQFSKAAEAFDRHEDAVAQEQKTRIDLRIATNRLQQFLRDLCSEGAVYGDLLFTVSDDDDAVVSITRIATISANPTPAQILAEIDPAKMDEADEPHQPDGEPEAVYTVGPVSGGAPTADETMAAMSSAWEPSDDELDHAAAREAIAIEARESGQPPLINLSSPSLAQAVEDLAAHHLNREIAAHEAKTGRPFDRSLL